MNFQARSSRDGKHFEMAVADKLTADLGFTITGMSVNRHGVEVDIEATSPDDRVIWFECKGGYETRPGLVRSDTMRKAIASGAYLKSVAPDRPPYVIVTTAIPVAGVSRTLFEWSLRDGLFDCILLLADLDDWSLPV